MSLRDGAVETAASIALSLDTMSTSDENAFIKSLGSLGALPTEVQIMIASYINPLQVWTCRRVSKGFQRLLQDNQVVLAALKKHATHDPADTVERKVDLSYEKVLKGHFTVPANLSMSKKGLPHACQPILCGKHLAYSCHDEITVVDLTTNESVARKTEDVVEHVALTSKLVAYTSEHMCYYYTFGGEVHSIQAPSYIVNIAGYDDRLAIITECSVGYGLNIVDTTKHELVPGWFSRKEEIGFPVQGTMCMNGSSCLIATPFTDDDVEGWKKVAKMEPDRRAAVRLFQIALDGCKVTKVDGQLLPGSRKSGCIGTTFLRAGGEYHVSMHYADETVRYGLTLGPLHWRQSFGKGYLWKGVTWMKSQSAISNGYHFITRQDNGRGHQGACLLINDSFLIDWEGGAECKFTVFSFDAIGEPLLPGTRLHGWGTMSELKEYEAGVLKVHKAKEEAKKVKKKSEVELCRRWLDSL